jgi:Rod binding domain-containing protein
MTLDSIAMRPLETTSPTKSSPTEIASDFEALLIGQMLKSARSDSDGWFGTGEDSSSASLIEMAEDQIAKVLAKGGGLGLAGMITKSLDQAGSSSTVQMSGKLR